MMVDNKDLDAEIHPLKSEDGRPAESGRSPSEKEEPGRSSPARRHSRLSRCRAVAFFLSLFLCLLVAFIVSFIIPCPERPESQREWRIDYNRAVFEAPHEAVPRGHELGGTTQGQYLCVGDTLWSRADSLGANTSTLSDMLWAPDVDSDGLSDLLVLTREEEEASVHFYSGSSGSPVGGRGRLGADCEGSALLHITGTGAHYLLFPCAGSLCCRSVKSLLEEVTGAASLLQTDVLWERAINASTYRVSLASPGAILYQLAIPGLGAASDLLLVGSEACVLLNGQDLTPRWTLADVQVSRKPVLGHYKPDTVAVMIENGTSTDRQILLLDLSTGAILWHQPVPGLLRSPPSASLLTADHRSAFFFWGFPEGESTNQTETRDTPHSLYMVHPTLPSVRLELTNISGNIVAFTAVLLEPSRHAAYVLLTGPESPAAPGLVSLAKHKVRDSIASSRVMRLGHDQAKSDQAIRDRFSRLRYRSKA
ncbi:protein FAM234A [Echinops telfairi]|uniref:Protein FAM234A n=1 Tax=Echinops telfairi TaxID=9371 RepID=A0AC55CP52_ECHTE|nr:protein FAM234A [Echinops telfairi]